MNVIVKWGEGCVTQLGEFRTDKLVEIPENMARIWISRGLCHIPECIEITYIGIHNQHTLKYGDEKLVLNKNKTRSLPREIVDDIWRDKRLQDCFIFGNVSSRESKILIDKKSENKGCYVIKYQGNGGDVLRATAVAETLYKDGYNVSFIVKKEFKCLLKNNPYIKYTRTTSSSSSGIPDNLIDLDMIRVHGAEAKNILRIDTWLEELGYENSIYRKSSYFPTDSEIAKAKKIIRNQNKLVIGLGINASVAGKRWDKFLKLIKELRDREYEVIVLDTFIDGKYKHEIRQMAALVAVCDVIICNDSLILHIAGALDKHCIGLFGNTDGKVTCQSYSNCKVVQGKCSEADKPCWYKQCKDWQREIMPCLKSIQVKDVISALEDIIC